MVNQRDDSRQLVIYGAGGHAVSVANVALSAGYALRCFVDADRQGTTLLGVAVVASLDALAAGHEELALALAIGDNAARERQQKDLGRRGGNLRFPALVHRSAVLSSFSTVGEGTIVMPNAVVGPNAVIGRFCLINTQASIDHDGVMQDFASLAPGARTGGAVTIEARSALSLNAAVKQGVSIGNDTVVGANSYVDRNLPDHCLAYGTPAKIIRQRETGDPYLT
jgi:sugar O-acyltransferase (sialic acid O-acetyltransferase NeuD family)